MEKATPLVSVVINSYNQAQFLEQTIQSVLQVRIIPTWKYFWSTAVPQMAAWRSSNVMQIGSAWWVSEKDNGQAEGINKGLKRAKGELVAWLNSDDYFFPKAISRAVECWDSRPDVVLIYGDVMAVDENDKMINRMRTGDWQLRT